MAQVVSHRAEIEAAGANVVTVFFEESPWSRVWLEETGSPFPFLVDPERKAYRAYGLRSSAVGSWGPANLWYYLKARLRGRKTLGRRGDAHQLGGDFVVDRRGLVRLAHPSRNPTDRPTVGEILAVVEGLGR